MKILQSIQGSNIEIIFITMNYKMKKNGYILKKAYKT